jgi:hypothetical protein
MFIVFTYYKDVKIIQKVAWDSVISQLFVKQNWPFVKRNDKTRQ